MIVGVVAQRANERAVDLAGAVIERLETQGITVRTDQATAEKLDREPCSLDAMDRCDLVVSIGGDGTFLYAARGAGATPILGVNLGEVGFLNTVAPENAIEAVETEVAQYRETGSIRHREVPRVRLKGEDWTLSPALNEVLVQGRRRGHADGIEASIRIDESHYEETHCDGVLVATPTGSTAYNLSEGGPLVHPRTDAFVVTTMSGASAMPPLVVPEKADIEIEITGAAEAVVSSDGSEHRTIRPPTTVSISAAAPAKVAGPGSAFFEALGKLE
ncbi:NAD(+)/NADH kinase [Halodesulfurarchaeum formicicum]|uniref:NAD kinase n=1 Tax=Halodesulfurarchaeum formicicum TaxID=1873524 RepID=A0A1J1AEU9_9EURY|nr:NAD(+)/NADH kinase [Halodesulfurarchaeum formicicum]APE96323.1 NAD+ kinase [Halodesulfurarchaeum formicicum]